MGHTNSTVNYNLPQFVGSDKPSWLGDVNGAFLAIDTAIAAAKSQADSAAGGVAGLQTTVSGHTTQIGTLTDTVTAQGGTLNSVTALIGNGTPTTTDQTIIGAINEINSEIIKYKDITKTSTQYGVIDISPTEIGGTLISGASVSGAAVFGPSLVSNAYRFITIQPTYPNLTMVGELEATIRIAYIPE